MSSDIEPSPSARVPGCRAGGLEPRAPPGLRRRRDPPLPGVRHRVRLAAAVRRATVRDLLAGVLRAVAPRVAGRPAGDEGDVVRTAASPRSSGAAPRRCSTSGARRASSCGARSARATSCSASTSTPRRSSEAAAALPDAAFHAGTLADDPFGDERFDAITMIDFIEHVRDPEAELRLAGDRLAPGGRLLISTPRADSTVARATGRYWPQYREEHLTYFSLAGLAAVLQRAGLVVVRVVRDAQGRDAGVRVRPGDRVPAARRHAGRQGDVARAAARPARPASAVVRRDDDRRRASGRRP